MTRELGLGPPARSAVAAAGIQRGGGRLAARRDSAQQDSAQQDSAQQDSAQQDSARHSPLGSKADRSAGQAVGRASETDPAGERGADGGPRTAGLPSRPLADGPRPLRPSVDGGVPALQRELGAHGRETVRRLLEAGLVEFDETGFQAARVEDIVRRAKTSHGTFYLYFANKDDLLRTLLRDALIDMANIADEFPVVTSNEAGRAALRRWVRSFSDTYAAHATVIGILSQAEIVGENVFGDGLQLLFRLSEAMTQGMTAAGGSPAGDGLRTEHAELTAVACLMMLERINYLLSAEVRLPRDEMIDRLTAIIYAAFRS
jgi:AcrR family transcriptional regulator